MAELPVYYETRRVGIIETHEDGPSFVYDPQWLRTKGAFPLSILMPLSPRRTPPRVFEPWAANLLPEASQLRTIGRRIGAAPELWISIGAATKLSRSTVFPAVAGAVSNKNIATVKRRGEYIK